MFAWVSMLFDSRLLTSALRAVGRYNVLSEGWCSPVRQSGHLPGMGGFSLESSVVP